MYDGRDFTVMPGLADALQDAGCDNANVPDHCRGDAPHVRGCWVVDCLLARGRAVTEEEWLACENTMPMLKFLREKKWGRRPWARKRRLFSIACCRRIEHQIPEEGRQVLDTAERYADHAATDDELGVARRQADLMCDRTVNSYGPDNDIANFVLRTTEEREHFQRPRSESRDPADWIASWVAVLLAGGESSPTLAREGIAMAGLLRCVIGNPFRTTTVNSSWLTSTVRSLATGIYAEKAFDRLPILADALQDAGCDDADALGHLRSPGPHAKGCWVVDLVLGKQ